MIHIYLTCEEVDISLPRWSRSAEAIITDRDEITAHLFFDCPEIEVKPNGGDPDFFYLTGGESRVTVSFRDKAHFTGDAFRMLEPDPVEEEDEGEPYYDPYDQPMTEGERSR